MVCASRRRQNGGATIALSPAMLSQAMDQHNAIEGGSGAADYAIGVYGNTDSQHAVSGHSNVIAMQNPGLPLAVAPVVGGNNKRGGQGILTDVAVPALLLYANNTFKGNKFRKPRKSKSNSKSKSKKSLRKNKSRRNTRRKR